MSYVGYQCLHSSNLDSGKNEIIIAREKLSNFRQNREGDNRELK